MDELIPITSNEGGGEDFVVSTTEIVRELGSDAGVQKYLNSLRQQLSDIPELRAIHAGFGQSQEAYNLAAEDTSTPESRATATRAYEAREAARASAIDEHGLDAVKHFDRIMLDLTTTENSRYVSIHDKDMTTSLVNGLVAEASNREDATQPPFVPWDDSLSRFVSEHQQGREIIATAGLEAQPMQIPVTMFVSAENFESWDEGRGLDAEGRTTSAEKIDDFASRETPIPPIDDVSLYLLPDGRVVAKANNAHRVAAAIKRGDKTVPFNAAMGATMYSLDAVPPQFAQKDVLEQAA